LFTVGLDSLYIRCDETSISCDLKRDWGHDGFDFSAMKINGFGERSHI